MIPKGSDVSSVVLRNEEKFASQRIQRHKEKKYHVWRSVIKMSLYVKVHSKL